MGSGCTCVVTGASQGIGREVALQLAKLGFTVVMVARNSPRLFRALEYVRSGRPNGEAVATPADLSRMAEVRRLADHIKQRFSELHSLIHCAAVILKRREITPEGFEATFATNVMAPFLLSQLLYEPLQLGRPSRVVFFYGGGKSSFDLGNLMSERHFDGWAAYNQTKNANVMVSIEMGQQWQSAGIAVNSVFPGLVKTAILREIPWYLRAILTPLRPLLRTPTEGAAAPVWAVTAPELATVSGKLFGSLVGDPRREFQLPRVTRNSHNRQQLVNLLRVWTSLSAGQEGMAPPRAVA